MSKYNFELDLSHNSSTGLILEKIKEGSVVLEFGCANGRMTKYMQQQLNCKVYIVEYDSAAYSEAINYAEDGLCGDILGFEWLEKFGHIRFDAVIFADVLEHLSTPEPALEKAAQLLKDDGSIYVSLPNITHNDIILKSVENRVDYTPTGIMDDTHMYFWGLENIRAMSGKNGLYIKTIQATYCPVGYTEQYSGENIPDNTLLKNILGERQCGEVYQFVVTMDKKAGEETVTDIKPASVKSHIYFDSGNDFNTGEIADVQSYISENGVYKLRYTAENTIGLKRLRIDPLEFQPCIVERISVCQSGTEIELEYPDAVKDGDKIFIYSTDPYVYTKEFESDGSPVTVEADFIVAGSRYTDTVQQLYVSKNKEFDALNAEYTAEKNILIADIALKKNYIDNLTAEISQYKADIERLNNEIELKQNHINNLDGIIESLTAEKEMLKDNLQQLLAHIEKLEEEKAHLQDKLDMLGRNVISLEKRISVLSDEKFKLNSTIAGLNSELAQTRTDLSAYIVLADSKDRYAMELEQKIEKYRKIPSVKIYDFICKLTAKIKKAIKKLKNRYK